METLTLGKIVHLLKRKFNIIMTFALIGFLAGILYALIVFKPIYKSTATLWIKNNYQSNSEKNINEVGINPALTQMQIIKSENISKKVWEIIRQRYNLDGNPEDGVKFIKEAISINNPAKTNIIKITARWIEPEIAKNISEEFANAYIVLNNDISKQEALKNKLIIDRQLAEAEKNLKEIWYKIKKFKKTNSIIDLKLESENLVNQIANLENKCDELISKSSAEANKVNSIEKKLGINRHQAINYVSLGNNLNFIELHNRMSELEQKQAALASKYTDYHPSKVSIDAEINNIKEQIGNYMNATAGLSTIKINKVINNSIKTGMLNSLISSQINYAGFNAEAAALKKAINILNSKKIKLLQQQLFLNNIMQEEANWSDIVKDLKTKQAEANLKITGVLSNISLIDSSSSSIYPIFPDRVQFVTLFTLFSILLTSAVIIITAILKDACNDIEQIEKDLHSTVLGVIPWLTQEIYDESDELIVYDESSSFHSLAYQKIVSGLRIKGYNSNINALAFTSSEFSKFRSTIIVNTAYALNKTGQSVVIVDADFRTPSISQEFKLKINDRFNLAELLSEISKEKKSIGVFNWEKLGIYTQEIPHARKFCVIPNAGNVPEPCKFLYSTAFNELIQELKKRFDWVLIDVPPALAVPDAVTVGVSVDGMVLVTGLDANRTVLRKIYKQFKNYGIQIFGIVARELNTKETDSVNGYINQMVARMMPQNEKLFTEE